MREFAEAFLLVFAQLAVGGLFALSIPPFLQIERGFFKSTAGVYLGAALLPLIGWTWILLTRDVDPGTLMGRWTEVALWGAFSGLFSVYLYSLWGDPYELRARSYAAALLFGIVALSATALRYSPGGWLPGLLYPVAFAVSALLLGAAATGMLLGHWYLIDVGLTLTPFLRIHRFFLAAIHLEVLILVLAGGLLWMTAGPALTPGLERLWGEHAWLFILRITLGPLAAYGLAWMIGRTLAIPQTMAATGLFYVALLAVIVGEILGRTLLFRTAFPI